MKKLISAVCAMLMAVLFIVPAFAVTESDIINELKAGVKIGDTVKQIPEKYIKTAEEFLAANDLSADELATAMSDLEAAKELWISTGETEFKNIPKSIQDQLISMATASAKKVGATLSFDGKTISIVDKNGNKFSVLASNDNPIKQTGTDNTILCLFAVITLAVLAASVFGAYKYRLYREA